MKKYLSFAFLFAAVAAASAEPQQFSARMTRQRTTTRETQTNVSPGARPVGALPRTARNPIQMVNPAAPPRYYGPPQETVAPDPYNMPGYRRARDGSPYTGVILFGLTW